MNILITGGAGYLGSLIIKKFINNKAVSKIIVIDILDNPSLIEKSKKLIWIKKDLATDEWQQEALKYFPIDLIIHTAFKIRNSFGKIRKTAEDNLTASKKIFEFCFDHNVEKLIYLSSVAVYGAGPENIGLLIKEEDSLKEEKSPYGIQKRIVEEMLYKLISEKKTLTQVVVLRLASITGPYGQSLKNKFGLIIILKKFFPFIIELHPNWGRQFVHEDDLMEIIDKLSFGFLKGIKNLEIFNVATENFLTAKDMAEILNKKLIKLPPWIIKIGLTLLWPISFKKLIPPSSINTLIYPININGKKIAQINFNYRYSSKEALLADKGSFINYV